MKAKGIIPSATVLGTLLAVGCSMSIFAYSKGTVTADQINIRQSADTESAKLGQLFEGDEINILSGEGNWFKIDYNNQEGYVFSDYISVSRAEGTVGADNVNVRNLASTSSDVVGTVNSGDVVTVVGSNDEWYEIIRTNGDKAFVSKNYVEGSILDKVGAVKPNTNTGDNKNASSSQVDNEEPVGLAASSIDDENDGLSVSPIDDENGFTEVSNKYAAVTASGLRVRSGAGTNFDILTTLEYGSYVDVLAISNEWIKISDGNVTGFISAEYASVRDGEKPSRGTGNSEKGQAIVDYAKQFLGTPYSWGGTNLNSGVDCSGFVYSVFKNFGISLERSSASMAYADGVQISKGELAAGDLVFFDTNGTNNGQVSHVGIYIGDGQYIHSSSGKSYCVVISSLYDDYSARTYVMAKRIFR